MKITAKDEKNSSTHWTAYSVDTPITREVADQFRELYAQHPDSGGIKVVIQYSLVLIQAVTLPAKFVDFVSEVLAQAESMVAQEKEPSPQMEQLVDDQKMDAQKFCEELESPDDVKMLHC
jgi:transcriptional/translational regulatory protein YebC/TACO1